MKRFLEFTLALWLIFGCLTGCRREETPETTAPAATMGTELAAVPTTLPETFPTTEPATLPTETEPVDTEALLLDILEEDGNVIPQSGHSQPLSDYIKTLDASAAFYALVDFDWDGRTEMILMTTSPVHSYIVLHYSQGDVFAAVFGSREMGSLKADGTFTASSGAAASSYFSLRFNGGSCIMECTASGDDITGIYQMNGQKCTKAQFDAYSTAWHGKEDIQWVILEAQDTFTPYIENISSADQAIYAGPGYDYGYVCIVEIAGMYTIVAEEWDYEGNLWGKLKSGVGWVNLTEVRQRRAQPLLLTVGFADDTLLNSGEYHYFCSEHENEYTTMVALRAGDLLVDFVLFTIDPSIMAMGEQLYYMDELRPDRPLVAELSFPGDLTTYGISFMDRNGIVHYYSLYISGRDGSLVLTPWE